MKNKFVCIIGFNVNIVTNQNVNHANMPPKMPPKLYIEQPLEGPPSEFWIQAIQHNS